MKITFLKRFLEFDRNKPDEQLQTIIYHSANTINSIESDIRNGGKINNPIELMIHNNRALLVDGHHRIAAAINAGLNEVPTKIIIKGKLTGELKNRWPKFKKLTNE